MLYSQSSYDEVPTTIVIPALPLHKKIEYTFSTARSPFVTASLLRRIQKRLYIALAHWVYRWFGATVYSEDHNSILYQLSPESRALLSWLVDKKLVESWWFAGSVPGYPKTKVLIIKPALLEDPGGNKYQLTGANGVGTGSTFQEASLSALGEYIERLASSSYWWEHTNIVRSVYRAGADQIDPRTLVSIDSTQVVGDDGADRFVADFAVTKSAISWQPSIDLVSGLQRYVPAAACYIFSRGGMVEDPYFHEVSSNGVAAHTNYYEACTRAVLEYIERDRMLRAWYHGRVGTRISLESVADVFPDAQQIVSAQDIMTETYLIDATDDVSIPVVFGVRIDARAEARAVHFTAAADLDYNEAVRKSLKELIRFSNSNYHLDSNNTCPSTVTEMQAKANSLDGRGELWAHQEMIEHIRWFVSGPERTLSEVLATKQGQHAPELTYAERYAFLQKVFREHDLNMYLVNLSNTISRHAGLTVVRSLTPDLIPMFFGEQYKPEAHPRLNPVQNGCEKLNDIPHPFI